MKFKLAFLLSLLPTIVLGQTATNSLVSGDAFLSEINARILGDSTLSNALSALTSDASNVQVKGPGSSVSQSLSKSILFACGTPTVIKQTYCFNDGTYQVPFVVANKQKTVLGLNLSDYTNITRQFTSVDTTLGGPALNVYESYKGQSAGATDNGGFYVGMAAAVEAHVNAGGVFTTLASAAAAGANTVIVNDALNSSNFYINILLNDGTYFSTQVSALSTDKKTVTINPALPSAANSGNKFFAPKGEFQAYVSGGLTQPAATALVGVEAFEANLSLRVGSSAFFKCGFCSINNNDDFVQASTPYDMAFGASRSAVGSTVTNKYGMLFSNLAGQQAVGPGSIVFGSIGATTVDSIIDFSSYTVSGNYFNFQNATLTGAGSLTLKGNLKALNSIISADSYGADPTGVVDSSAAWNSAIAQATAYVNSGKGRAIVYGCGQYKLTNQILVRNSGVSLEGCATDSLHNISSPNIGTRFFWAGPSNATMVIFGYASSGANTVKKSGGGIKNIKIDAMSIAGNPLEIDSWNGGVWENITLYNPSVNGYGLMIKSITFGSNSDDAALQMNLFRNISIRLIDTPNSVARGVVLDDDNNTHDGNPSFNTFDNIDVLSLAGEGIDCRACDNNVFNNVRVYTVKNLTQGGAPGVRLRASSAPTLTFGGANANIFNHLSPGTNGVLSEGTEYGTYPAVQNVITAYDKTNGSPEPVVGTSSTLTYSSTDPAWTNWTPTFGACTPGATAPTFNFQSARYKRINNTVSFNLSFQELNKNTATGCVTFTLPLTPLGNTIASGHDTVSSKAVQAWITDSSTQVRIYNMDGSDPNTNNDFFVVGGTFEAK